MRLRTLREKEDEQMVAERGAQQWEGVVAGTTLQYHPQVTTKRNNHTRQNHSIHSSRIHCINCEDDLSSSLRTTGMTTCYLTEVEQLPRKDEFAIYPRTHTHMEDQYVAEDLSPPSRPVGPFLEDIFANYTRPIIHLLMTE